MKSNNTGQPQRTAHTKNVRNPEIKNPAVRKFIEGRTDQLKPLERERLGRALDLFYTHVLHRYSAVSEVAEWVERNCNYDERRRWGMELASSLGYDDLTLAEEAALFGVTPEKVRQDKKRLSDKLKKQFPHLRE